MTDPSLRAIETRYAGHRFRSRLEARWAVFFDALELPWEYEPQGFELPSGCYLPDFWLPTLNDGTWFEVKGVAPTDRENTFAEELCILGGKDVAIAFGSMPRSIDDHGYERGMADERRRIEVYIAIPEADRSPSTSYSWDLDYAFCACPWCARIGLQYDARGARVCGWRTHHSDPSTALDSISGAGHYRIDDRCHTGDDRRIATAYAKARAARFEHGERG